MIYLEAQQLAHGAPMPRVLECQTQLEFAVAAPNPGRTRIRAHLRPIHREFVLINARSAMCNLAPPVA